MASSSSPLTELPSSPSSPVESPSLHQPLVTPVRFFPISLAELSLRAVLKCGQTFRWNQSFIKLHPSLKTSFFANEDSKSSLGHGITECEEWSMGWNDRTIVLRQDDLGVHYVALYPPSATEAFELDSKSDTTYERLKRYFVLDVSLVALYREWSRRDPIFSTKVASGKWDGLRVCRQDAWETMVAFICSSNNNIPRISLMLSRLCATFGDPMPTAPLGVTLSPEDRLRVKPSEDTLLPCLFSFPTPSRLSQPDVHDQLKQLGFGYRANYVFQTSARLCEIAKKAQQEGHWPLPDASTIEPQDQKPILGGEPDQYLDHLSQKPYEIAHGALVNQFPGIGRKVADCICLFGLGFVQIVPVDVHVYQIAIRDYQIQVASSKKTKPSQTKPVNISPSKVELSSKGPVSKSNYDEIQKQLHQLWGPWAGWAQQILFLADLKHPNLASPIKKKRKLSQVIL
ncbi:hypothetical protein O181_038931 [Austropuccinia psidii MF-1]|uniref:DNA-(apurinic or apyrimidinic site) lyase n=1 Tax=Austropuccinia psidii MF-1 TaxID=1389203 RepID=A0A9Q3D8T9_9BASI|nr:hypothetical protein [Austropuccinia psidii MF-1]